MRSFVVAWEFLTTIPLPVTYRHLGAGDLSASMGWFPLVGLVLGVLVALADMLASAVFPATVVNLLIIVVLVVVTGGLHLDGLADAIDGLAGGRTAADRLRIMRDVHIGAIGATGLVLALGLRYAGLAALPASHRLALLACMPLVGRWAIVISSLGMRYARTEGGLAQPFLQQLSMWHGAVASVSMAAVLIWSVGVVNAVATATVVAVLARGISILARRLIGGVTGDILGATNEVAEVAFLVAAPVIIGLELSAYFSR